MAKLTGKFLKMLRDNGVTHYRDADGLVLRLAPAPAAEPPPARETFPVRDDRRGRRLRGEEHVSADQERADLGLPDPGKRPENWEPS